MRVVVLGADSYLGSRVLQWAEDFPLAEAVGWAMCRTSDTDYNGLIVYGVDKIEHVVRGADVVVNLHEAQDLSLLPDLKSLYCNNVKLVEHLISLHALPGHNWKLVHLSTPFLQCSSRWPNVNNSEIPLYEIPPSRPYKSYCTSKYQADELLSHSSIDCILVRPVPLYGEGDICSTITDIMKISSVVGFVPRIGDDDGVMQMMTVENAVSGIWKAVEKLGEVGSTKNKDSTGRIFEIVVLSDNTEKSNFFKNFGDIIQTNVQIPFLLPYYLYVLVAAILQMLSIIYVAPWMKKLPDPDYFYMNYYHWSFFNNYKAREYLNYTPLENENQRRYYQKLEPTAVKKFSWENLRPSPVQK